MNIVKTEPDDLESSISIRIDELCARPEARNWKRGEWTEQTKNELAAMAHEKGFKAYASTCETADGGEWMFDLCWIDYSNPILKAVPLAAEFEFNSKASAALEDFQKLLVARAEHRLMLFVPEGRNADHAEATASLVRDIPKFAQGVPGDRYQVGCWDEMVHRYRWQCWKLSSKSEAS